MKSKGSIKLFPAYSPLQPNTKETMKQAFQAFNSGNLALAQSHCAAVIRLDPKNFDALQLMGAIAFAVGNNAASIHYVSASLEIKPNEVNSLRNRAMAFERLNQLELAIQDCVKAIHIQPTFAEAHYLLGNLYSRTNAPEKSVEHYDRAISIKPSLNYIYGSRLMEAMKVCNWEKYQDQIDDIETGIREGKKVSPPFAASTLLPHAGAHKACAAIWSRSEYPNNAALGPITSTMNTPKIRLGYISSDFRNHPVSYLAAELFEIHDRSKFEVIAFSTSNAINDPMQIRLRNAFDAFHDVAHLPDIQLAQYIRGQQIDILIDLGGYTTDSRFGALTFRAAPIQIEYLGYLGTTGSPYIDYLIADHTLIPDQLQHHYSEKIIFLQNYQVNDSKSKECNPTPVRSAYGLPEGAFVFCCFNSAYKLNPTVFDSWCRILLRAENSVLILVAENPLVEKNLRHQARLRGVDDARIVFSTRLPRPDFLARFKAADVFLDTWPCNAGTTASEALWCGLPVLTLPGESFASRMGASLLNAIGVPELIADSIEQYEELAVRLAHSSREYAAVFDRVSAGVRSSSLFDCPTFAKGFEHALGLAFDRHRAGQPPCNLTVD